jgi:hypothetical protein
MPTMSALGQKRTNLREPKSDFVRFGPIADKLGHGLIVCFVPEAEIDFVLGTYRCVATGRRTRTGDDDNRTSVQVVYPNRQTEPLCQTDK